MYLVSTVLKIPCSVIISTNQHEYSCIYQCAVKIRKSRCTMKQCAALGGVGIAPQCFLINESGHPLHNQRPGPSPAAHRHMECATLTPRGPYKIPRSPLRVRRASNLHADACFPPQKLRRSPCLVASIRLGPMEMVFTVSAAVNVRDHPDQKYLCRRTRLSHSNVCLSPEKGAVCNIRRRARCLVSPFRDSASGPG